MCYIVFPPIEFLETVVKHKTPDEEVAVHLVTMEDEFKGEQQRDSFENMRESANAVGMNFTWEFDVTGTRACPPHSDEPWVENLIGSGPRYLPAL